MEVSGGGSHYGGVLGGVPPEGCLGEGKSLGDSTRGHGGGYDTQS